MMYKIAKSKLDVKAVLLSMDSGEVITMKSWCIDWTISRKLSAGDGSEFCLDVPGKDLIYYNVDQMVSEIMRHRKAFNDHMRFEMDGENGEWL